MSVAIRFSRVGTKHVPFFRMVVVDSRKKRDGAVIEVLGTYDARQTTLVNFKPEKFDEWVKKGAQPSDSAKKVYKLFKLQQAGKTTGKKLTVETVATEMKETAPKPAAKKKEAATKAVEELIEKELQEEDATTTQE